MPHSIALHAARAALVALALTGCVGIIGGDSSVSPGDGPPVVPPGTDGGVWTETPDAWAPPGAIYPFATVGSRCEGGATREYLVLSSQPPDCAAHAAAFTTDDAARFARIALPGTPSFQANATLCADGACAPTTLSVNVTTSETGAAGDWIAVVGGRQRGGTINAMRCDYDAFLPQGDDTPVGDLTLREVALYQGVKVTIARDGEAVAPNAPIVANRGALLRLFVAPRSGYVPRELVARVQLGDAAPIEARATLIDVSRDDALGSTFNLSIPPAALTPDVPISVGIYDPAARCGGGSPDVAPARFPAAGTALLPARSMGGTFRIVLVPVRYTADGSGRLPDTSGANVQRFADEAMRLFPVEGVDVTVRARPLDWPNTIGADGSGWSALLNECGNQRAQDGAPPDTYYYCLFSPSQSFGDFCGRGCVAGLGFVPGAQDDRARVSIGLGYSGTQGTFVHEVGHTLGRPHAPCGGVAGPDPSFPYAGGSIGSWGYDILTGELKDPAQHADILGYCDPTWISDYNYGLIFDRIRAVRGTRALIAAQPQTYATIVVDVDGSLSWGSEVELQLPPQGEPVRATWSDASGASESVDAVFAQVDHIDGGIVYVPMPSGAATRVALPGYGALDVR
ncbi:Hypothetical protein I5071_66210 [Sandaracinus amylolyticus]|nr:Hypothetical protein I5071_66210 [Sandaracinus amylolyticus]